MTVPSNMGTLGPRGTRVRCHWVAPGSQTVGGTTVLLMLTRSVVPTAPCQCTRGVAWSVTESPHWVTVVTFDHVTLGGPFLVAESPSRSKIELRTSDPSGCVHSGTGPTSYLRFGRAHVTPQIKTVAPRVIWSTVPWARYQIVIETIRPPSLHGHTASWGRASTVADCVAIRSDCSHSAQRNLPLLRIVFQPARIAHCAR
ncbi:hypothetical protein PCASD_26701 [Puccinia coronata f. sp. avenae]|uniref:Uncharacterized protein n=1 Tax=Puccinia coronata f. sp. avenae TaxID=200324 RepID=A0A2N5RUQ2_9BASI|nr:hypothetical protein PCASD_26701 [Puccinia coronata f. sp. avenae]